MKQEINRRLKELEKLGYLVFNFSFNKYLPKSLVGLPDFLIIKKGKIYFIELKLKRTKDKLSEKQIAIKEKIERFGFDYYVINEENINTIIDKIIAN